MPDGRLFSLQRGVELWGQRSCGRIFCLERFFSRAFLWRFHTRGYFGILPEKGLASAAGDDDCMGCWLRRAFFEGQLETAWPGVRLLVVAPTLAMWKMMGNAAVWFIARIMAFLALFPWLRRCYGKKLFLCLLSASVLFAAVRSGLRSFAVVDSDGLYYR